MNRASVLPAVLLVLGVLFGACGVAAADDGVAPWNERPGTVAWARDLPLFSHVYLDAENIVKIRARMFPAIYSNRGAIRTE